MRQIHESGENYLEVILEIQREMGEVRSVEIARRVGVSRASVSKALAVLRDMGLVEQAYYGNVALTPTGMVRAKAIQHRHDVLYRYLREILGVSQAVAQKDACRIEHVVSEELIGKIEDMLEQRTNTIRLVAADMDGTLLNSQKQFSKDFLPYLQRLREKGIAFAVASGRQYQNLYAMFGTMADTLFYIAENGAAVYAGSTCLFVDEMPSAHFVPVIVRVRQLEGVSCVLCTKTGAYIENTTDAVFLEHAKLYYHQLEVVDDLLETLSHTPAFKLAVFEQGCAEQHSFPEMQSFADRFHVVLSGADWIDLMNPNTNKGTGLRHLAEHLHITPQQTMAFGDYLNDIELLQQAGISFAMENAHAQLKEIADHIAPSNDADGVMQMMQQYFGC